METRRCPGRVASGTTRVVAKGTSKGDRAASRVTVTETGLSTVRAVLSTAVTEVAGFGGVPCATRGAAVLTTLAAAMMTVTAATRDVR